MLLHYISFSQLYFIYSILVAGSILLLKKLNLQKFEMILSLNHNSKNVNKQDKQKDIAQVSKFILNKVIQLYF